MGVPMTFYPSDVIDAQDIVESHIRLRFPAIPRTSNPASRHAIWRPRQDVFRLHDSETLADPILLGPAITTDGEWVNRHRISYGMVRYWQPVFAEDCWFPTRKDAQRARDYQGEGAVVSESDMRRAGLLEPHAWINMHMTHSAQVQSARGTEIILEPSGIAPGIGLI